MPLGTSFWNSHWPTGPLLIRVFVVVREQERQIERLELLGAQRREFRGRGREHLHRAELQCLDLFLVLVELGVRIDLHFDLVAGVLLGKLLEFLGALALRGVGRGDVAELDDDGLLRLRRKRKAQSQEGGKRTGKQGTQARSGAKPQGPPSAVRSLGHRHRFLPGSASRWSPS
jgi:hypothetical protein